MRFRSSTRTAAATVEPRLENQRHDHRQKLRTLAYVTLGGSKAGVLRDISESGVAVHVLSTLTVGNELHLGLDLPNPRLRFEADVRVVWTDSLGQTGLEFVNLPERARLLLKDWLFTQLLSNAQRTGGESSEELLFSGLSRPTIRLVPHNARRVAFSGLDRTGIPLMWFSVPAHSFSRFVDAVAVSSAVLLFSLMTLFLTDVTPIWWVGMLFIAAAAVIFGGVYWMVFAFWFGITPGARLAELATPAGKQLRNPVMPRPRFR